MCADPRRRPIMSAAMAYRYHLLRAALHAFDRPPHHLDARERAEADRLARQAMAIESRVLDAAAPASEPPGAVAVGAAVVSVVARFEDRAAFDHALARAGLDETALGAAIERRLAVDARLDAVAATVQPAGDAEVEAFYAQHAGRFRRPERRRLLHILVTLDPAFPENTPSAARRRIEAVRERLKAAPERFAEEARRHSECPSALQGGLLGLVTRAGLPDGVADAAFALALGEVSAVVASPFGFHVFRCDGIEPARTDPLDEVRAKIARALDAARREQAKRRWIRTLASAAPHSTTPAGTEPCLR
ncbi:MAG: nitrogen fixation protein NifM [Roseicyclus sp.]